MHVAVRRFECERQMPEGLHATVARGARDAASRPRCGNAIQCAHGYVWRNQCYCVATLRRRARASYSA
jgi:hypothetical protein